MRLEIILRSAFVACLAYPPPAVSAQGARGLRDIARNPLLRGVALPRYAEISHEHVTEAMRHLHSLADEKIAAIERDEATDFAALFDALGEINIYLSRIWQPLEHLHRVRNEDSMRPLHEQAQQQVETLALKLAQNPVIYRKLLELERDTSLNAVQRRMVKLRLDTARELGGELEGQAQARFNAISEELAALGVRFINNSLDATKDFQLILRTKDETAGLPASILARAAKNYTRVTGAGASAEEGPWLITLDFASYKPFMEYSERRDLREKVFRAYINIAAHPPFDNTPLIQRILQLRKEQAQLLGFPHHAARVLSTKMAGRVGNVHQLLDELHAVGYPRFIGEQEQLRAYSVDNGAPSELEVWDIYYWERKMKEEQFDLDPEALRQYFPLPRVLDGLLGLLSQLFGLSIEEHSAGVQVWHPDVKFYQVRDANGMHIASFYFDPYSRPQNKSGGAWVSMCNNRHRHGEASVEIPVCHVVANFSPPTGDKPALLDMREVTTLFHEFGHAMHALLTTVDYGEVAGTEGVEWDAIEMPSNLMENFIYLDQVIAAISGHIESGDSLPTAMVARLQRLKNFRAASQLQGQLFYSYFDLRLHTDFDPDTQSPLELMRKIYLETLAKPPLADDRFPNNFRHIFAGGYDANYYSYKWGEVLAADAFELFKENGFDAEGLQRSGRKYRDTVLAVGGSKSAQDIFIELRGHLPAAQALLKSYGLVE